MASQAYIGAIFMFAGNFAPRNYMLCQGQLLAIAQYSALFSILGTTYGGNGTSNFGLPDLRGRAPIGQGTGLGLSTVVLGEVAGVENVTLLSSNMPQHNHLINAVSGAGNQSAPTSNLPAAGALTVTHPAPNFPALTANNYSNSSANTTLAATTVGFAGSNIPLSIRNPYLVVNYIICVIGLFPSRN